MTQIKIGVAAFPVLAPLVDELVIVGLPVAPFILIQPLEIIRNNHRRCAALHIGRDGFQVPVAHNNAAVAVPGRAAVGITRGAMQPDTVAGAPVTLVPDVRVINRKCPVAVQIRQFIGLDETGNEIDAYRRSSISFRILVGAVPAYGGVKIINQHRHALAVLKQIQPGLTGIHNDGVALMGAQFDQHSGNMVMVFGRRMQIMLPAGKGLIAEGGDLFIVC